MLARGAHPFCSIITASRANKSYLVAPHIVHRELSGLTFRRPNAATIKLYEAEIERINKDPSLSEDFKYRNSDRVFTLIDLGRKRMEIEALHAKAVPTLQILNALVKGGNDGTRVAKGILAMLKEEFHAGGVLGRELAHLQCRVFKLSVFFAAGRCLYAGTRGSFSALWASGFPYHGRADH